MTGRKKSQSRWPDSAGMIEKPVGWIQWSLVRAGKQRAVSPVVYRLVSGIMAVGHRLPGQTPEVTIPLPAALAALGLPEDRFGARYLHDRIAEDLVGSEIAFSNRTTPLPFVMDHHVAKDHSQLVLAPEWRSALLQARGDRPLRYPQRVLTQLTTVGEIRLFEYLLAESLAGVQTVALGLDEVLSLTGLKSTNTGTLLRSLRSMTARMTRSIGVPVIVTPQYEASRGAPLGYLRVEMAQLPEADQYQAPEVSESTEPGLEPIPDALMGSLRQLSGEHEAFAERLTVALMNQGVAHGPEEWASYLATQLAYIQQNPVLKDKPSEERLAYLYACVKDNYARWSRPEFLAHERRRIERVGQETESPTPWEALQQAVANEGGRKDPPAQTTDSLHEPAPTQAAAHSPPRPSAPPAGAFLEWVNRLPELSREPAFQVLMRCAEGAGLSNALRRPQTLEQLGKASLYGSLVAPLLSSIERRTQVEEALAQAVPEALPLPSGAAGAALNRTVGDQMVNSAGI